MPINQLSTLLFEQSDDLIWMIDPDFRLVYANRSYLDLMKQVTGREMKLNTSVFVEGFGDGYVEKWKAYYTRALSGEHSEMEEFFHHPDAGEVVYSQVSLKPIRNDREEVIAVACQSKDITELAKQRSQANRLMDASLDVFCSINEDGDFVYVSEASSRHWGYEPIELKGVAYQSLILEEDVAKTAQIAEEIIQGKEVKHFVNRYRKKDGGVAFNLWSARWDPDAKLMYCVARDAKEHIEKEELIVSNEQRFKALVQEGSDLIGILDEEGNYTYVSPTSTHVLGITPEEFIGKSPFDYIHKEDADRVQERLSMISTENKVQITPFRFRNSAGEWRWIETVLTNMLDTPHVNGIVANSRDITDKIEEQRRLKLFESVITNAKDAVMITDAKPLDEPGPKIVYVNQAFTEMTGYTSEEVLGKTPRILQGPHSDHETLKKLGKTLRNWESSEVTTINYKKSGDEFWINFRVVPVADELGRYTHMVAIERDVTEQKNKELENEFIAEIGSTFNLENDYHKAIDKLCQNVAQFGRFDWVELWTIGLDKTSMRLMSHHVAEQEDEVFYTKGDVPSVFSKGEGLIGTVWAEGKFCLWEDVASKEDFIRRKSAYQIGLQSVLGIPLLFNDEVLGVLAIGVKRNSGYLKGYARIFQRLEAFLGSELRRKMVENDLSHLFEAIPDIVSVGDFEGRFLKINKAGSDLLGYSEDEILNASFEEFIHPDDVPGAHEQLKQLETGQKILGFEVRFITKSGETLWLSWYCKASISEGVIYSTAKNVTEEKKLRELNRQSRSLAKIGSWEVDLVKERIYWTEEVHELHGTDPDTYVPNLEMAINFYREDYREKVTQNIENSIATGAPCDFEAVIVRADKKERWVRAIGTTEFVDGKCVRFFGSFQDISERKEAELRLQSLADNLPGVVFEYRIYKDGTDELREVTKGAKQIWGYSAEAVMENNQLVWEQIVAGGDIDEVQKSIIDSIATRSKWSARWRYVMPSGEVKTHLGLGSPQFLSDGTVMFNSIILDITQAAKTEQLLKQTTEIAKIGSWEMNASMPGDDKMFWSSMVYDIYEIRDSFDPNYSDWLELHVGESRSRLAECMRSLIKHGHEFDEEVLIRTGEGNDKWIKVIGKCEWVNEQISKIYGSFQDIHESKTLEMRILEILDSISDAFYALDSDWRFTYFNREAEALLRKKEKDVIGKKIWDEFPATLGTELEDQYREVVQSNHKKSFEYHYAADDNWYEINAYPSNGGLSVYFKNISERKAHEEQLSALNISLQNYAKDLERSNEELEQFAFIASHDLQEPLRMITSFMDQLKRKYEDQLDQKALEYIHFASDGAKRMKQIILDLLEYSRAGRQTESMVNVDLNDILDDYKLLRRKIISEKSATITALELPLIYSYKTAVSQVLHSLLDNAIKYSKEDVPPKIKVTSTESGSEWILAVEDNGIGIDPAFHEKIFIIFQRLHNRNEYDGSGIGLSIAKKHMEFLGGRIWLKSTPGVGSTFYLSFPKDATIEHVKDS